MLVLRADPWLPDYGMGFDVAVDEELPDSVDPFVETDDWSHGISGVPRKASLAFVDGVRRIELRLLASDGDRRAPGLFGSYAVGVVHSNGEARFGEHRVRRALVVGGGLPPERTAIKDLVFDPECEESCDPDAPLLRLQRLMRAAEADLAKAVAAEPDRLVLADGPLGYTFYDAPTASPVVGVVKRSAREYLAPAQAALLGLLAAAQRTPLFVVGDERSRDRRFSWYVRIAPLRPPFHERSGLVRCELRYGAGKDIARAIAGHVAAALPLFAGRPWDPRTPQNVVPIAALEQWLRHRMGDTRLVRRAVMDWMTGMIAA